MGISCLQKWIKLTVWGYTLIVYLFFVKENNSTSRQIKEKVFFMKKKIIEKLKQLETEQGIRILFACESGSRAWGYSHENSDYDVRFIYLYPPIRYLTIDPQKDFIEFPVSEKLDITGWELQKCLRLYRKSNPGILEWINSSLIYSEPYSTAGKLRDYTKELLSSVPCMHHYLHMAEKNLHNGETKQLKLFFNILRPLLSAKWIEKHHLFPPVHFPTLLEETLPEGRIKAEIEGLLHKRIDGESTAPITTLMESFMKEEINRLTPKLKKMERKLTDPTPILNKIFYDSLKEVWGDKFYDQE